MGIRKFKFVSPGISVQEIDNSQLPKIADKIGPVVIGRARRGPALRPVKVESFSEFIEIFGNPIPGGESGDVWRNGNFVGPSYGTYAAQGWLKNNSPLTYVRLLGAQHEDAATAGEAGWETKDSSGNANGIGVLDSDGGAYGLFLINSSSHGTLAVSGAGDTTPQTGTLAAIFYLNEGSIVLSGTYAGGTASGTGSALLVKSVGNQKEFKAIIRNGSSTETEITTFNFNKNSEKYIRKVFNTNPVLANPTVTTATNLKYYWLGQTFERQVDEYVTNSTAGEVFGVILGLKGDASTKEGSDFRFGMQAAQSGWVFCQDTQVVSGAANTYQPENMTKLFKFHCLDTGEGAQNNIKISIEEIKPSSNQVDPYGTFTVTIRKVEDSDNAVRVIEKFSQCNLNPNSNNYIGIKIGDKYISWDDNERRYREYGNYDNRSRFVRVELNSDVDNAAINPVLLPFGVYGPVCHKGFSLVSGSDKPQSFGSNNDASDFTGAFVRGNADIVRSVGNATEFFQPGTLVFTGAFVFPKLSLRATSSDGNLSNSTEAYFGLDTSISRGSTRFDPGYVDYVYPMPVGYNSFSANTSETEYSWIFSLDDLSGSGANTTNAIYVSGSRAAGTSLTAVDADNYKGVLDSGFDRFTFPIYGGFNGVDITESDPFNNADMEGATETTNYAFNSVKRAIDCVADPEVVECNILTMPGLTHEGLTSHILTVCEDRADCLGIIDLKGGFIPKTENNSGDSSTANRGDVTTVIDNLKARGINSSYGCAYYPWVQARDTIQGSTLWMPSSVVGLGTMASSENKSELWFAPAGFNRGGLTEGNAGIPVVGVRQKLTAKERDKLYEANINPIASFPSEGIVIFGQKTLQVTPSALDRINVRRLLIYIKKELSRMASRVLFDQNTKTTWNRFLGMVSPFMRSVQSRFGVQEFKIVLDETTTTPELIDRNIMYAQMFIKPTRSIEFIAIDLSIESSGVSFVD